MPGPTAYLERINRKRLANGDRVSAVGRDWYVKLVGRPVTEPELLAVARTVLAFLEENELEQLHVVRRIPRGLVYAGGSRRRR